MARPKAAATKVIDFIEEHARIPEGKDVGKPVRLREWQKKNIRLIYNNPHGTRRAIVSFGRKNGKTAFAAFLLICHICGPRTQPAALGGPFFASRSVSFRFSCLLYTSDAADEL